MGDEDSKSAPGHNGKAGQCSRQRERRSNTFTHSRAESAFRRDGSLDVLLLSTDRRLIRLPTEGQDDDRGGPVAPPDRGGMICIVTFRRFHECKQEIDGVAVELVGMGQAGPCPDRTDSRPRRCCDEPSIDQAGSHGRDDHACEDEAAFHQNEAVQHEATDLG